MRVGLFLLALSVFVMGCVASLPPEASRVYFDDEDPSFLILGNAYYELGWHKSNGALAYLLDKSTHQSLTAGSRELCLWRLSFVDGRRGVGGCDYELGGVEAFEYAWSTETEQLTFFYTSSSVVAEVEVRVSEASWFDMGLRVENGADGVVVEVDFPAELLFETQEIEQALIPALPGVRLTSAFFREGREYSATYPAPLFADYLALTTEAGEFAMYVRHEARIHPVSLGLEYDNRQGEEMTYLLHSFHTDLQVGEWWRSPTVRIRVGASPVESIQGYRVDNGLERLPSLADKLGWRYETLLAAPLYKADVVQLYHQLGVGFADYPPQVLNPLPTPAILHLVAYWEGRFDENYPDFLPAKAAYGGGEALVAMVEAAQEMGFLVMPYMNPTWWNEGSPTLEQLPEQVMLSDLAVIDDKGEPVYKQYGERGGYVMSPHVPFVQERLDEAIRGLTIEVPSDLLFEDQIGARPWTWDRNPASPDPMAYSDGWLAHTHLYDEERLMTEGGYDRLAETEVGFHGGVLLSEWDGRNERWWGNQTWEPYPLATLMVRDKVLFYQHNLASQTMTRDKSTLMWNLAMGYMLSHNLSENKYGGGLDSEWLPVVSRFQKHVLASYADERVMDYQRIDEQVTRTDFESVSVIANWDGERAYEVGRHTLPPQGVMVTSGDERLRAGVFTHYNERLLSGGEHYLIEVRKEEEIVIYHPLGSETNLAIKPLATWATNASFVAEAYNHAGDWLGEEELRWRDGTLSFFYRREVAGQRVAFYRLKVRG